MIAFEAVAPDSGELTLAVLAEPGAERKSPVTTFKFVPLENWGPKDQ
jgi:hypothetical protein